MKRFCGTAIAMMACTVISAGAQLTSADVIGFASTPADLGVYGANFWAPPPDEPGGQGGEGFRIDWRISENPDLTWHYEYKFSNQDNGPLAHDVSHIIIQLSENIKPEDLFNFGRDARELEFDTFGAQPSNPGFPAGESIFGVKVDLKKHGTGFSFDCTRQPMWGDFYAKNGGRPASFAYNTDIGVEVVNADDYLGVPIGADNQPLHKILVPDTHWEVPEPATLTLLVVGAAALGMGRRRG